MASTGGTHRPIRVMMGWLAALAVVAAISPGRAHATIVINSSGLATFDHLVDFSTPSLAADTIVTGQYTPVGLTFAPLAGGAVRANVCGLDFYSSEGMPGDTLSTVAPGCATNTTDDSFSMTFAHAVSAVSFTVRSIRGPDANPGANTFTALLHGAVVEAFVHGNIIGGPGNHRFLTFTDLVLDEIRFSEDTPDRGNYFIIDNVAWVDGAVPQPSTLLLLGAGLAGLAAMTTWRRARRG